MIQVNQLTRIRWVSRTGRIWSLASPDRVAGQAGVAGRVGQAGVAGQATGEAGVARLAGQASVAGQAAGEAGRADPEEARSPFFC